MGAEIELDVHGERVAEALRLFREAYNREAKRPHPRDIVVIHGYGSSGQGGTIRRRLRALLAAHKAQLGYRLGEDVDGNPGTTVVTPHAPLPDVAAGLAADIVAYCSSPKPVKSITGKFRRHGVPQVREAVQALERDGQLKRVLKNGHKCYVRVG